MTEELYESTKQYIIQQLEAGVTEITLDVTRMFRRDRNRLRMRANDWMRTNNKVGRTRYDSDNEELTITVLADRDHTHVPYLTKTGTFCTICERRMEKKDNGSQEEEVYRQTEGRGRANLLWTDVHRGSLPKEG